MDKLLEPKTIIGTFNNYRGYVGTIEVWEGDKSKYYGKIIGTEPPVQYSASALHDMYGIFKSCVDSYINKTNEEFVENPLLDKYKLIKDKPYEGCEFTDGVESIWCEVCDSCPRGGKFIIPDDDISCFKQWNNYLIDFDRKHNYDKLKQAMYEDDGYEKQYNGRLSKKLERM